MYILRRMNAKIFRIIFDVSNVSNAKQPSFAENFKEIQQHFLEYQAHAQHYVTH